MEIREKVAADDPPMVELWNQGEPEPLTLEIWRKTEVVRGPAAFPLQAAAFEGDEVVGMALVFQFMLPPAWAQVVIKVDEKRRREGRGETLWRHALAHPVVADAPVLLGNIRDDDPASRAWAETRGFALWAHRFQSFLEVDGFDPAPYADAVAAVSTSGLTLCTLADVVDRPDVVDSYFDLYRRALLTTPDNDQGVEPERKDFDLFYLDPAQHPPEATQLALDGDRVVGMSSVALRAPGFVYTTMSGVDPDYRGRSIALALKVRSVAAARALGATRMGTNNLSINAPILAINDKMGYIRQPGLWLMRRPR